MEPRRPCILIIDDDFRLLEDVEQALAAAGYEALAAADADEGLWLMGRSPVDLVITEVILPGRDGLDVIGVVKSRPPMRVIATARGLWSKPWAYLAAARHVGADEVLAKPFAIEELLALVERQLTGPAEEEERRRA